MSLNLGVKTTDRSILVKQVRDAIKGQQHIRDCGTRYLPMTSGMASRYNSTEDNLRSAAITQYDAYKDKARFPNIVQETQNGIIGVAFKTDPVVETRWDKVTKNGLDAIDMSINQTREVIESGRSLVLVDIDKSGGDPYAMEYMDESIVGYAADDMDESKLLALKLKEYYFEPDDTYKENALTRYREYLNIDGVVNVTVQDENGDNLEEPFTIAIGYIPAFFAGSVDNMPSPDPILLLPVADSAYSIYKISADYMQYLHHHWQGTPYATGVSDGEADKIFSMGLGVGAFIALGSTEATVGMLQPDPAGDEGFIRAIDNELKAAEKYAISISKEGAGVEAAESIQLRAATKHANIYTILDSVSKQTVAVLNCMSEWLGREQNNEFTINTDFTSSELSAPLILALNATINSGNLPSSIVKNSVRKAGLTELTNDEMDAEILDAGGAGD